MNDLLVEVIEPGDWEARLPDWDELVAASETSSIFLTRAWVSCWWRHFGAGRTPLLLRIGSPDGTTVGLAPLYLQRARVAGVVPVRRVGLLGDAVVGSEYLGLVSGRGRETAVAAATLSWLRTHERWDVVDLIGLVVGLESTEVVLGEVSRLSSAVRTELHPCSRVELPDDFDAYLAGLGSGFRQSYRQRRNKLFRTCEVRVIRTEGVEDLGPHLSSMFEQHQSRWEAEGHSGSFADARMRAFYRDIGAALLERGGLRFWHLEIDGVIRASQFGFVHDGVLLSLQESYDATFSKRGVGGLGVVLRAAVIEAAIREGLRAYDFLGGEEDFKRRWGTKSHNVMRLRGAAPGVRGRAAWWATVGAAEARAFLRDVAPESVLRARRVLKRRLAQRGRHGRRGPEPMVHE